MQKNYFEGWYCSVSNGQESLALLPFFYLDAEGNEEAVIQLITHDAVYRFPYIEDFYTEIDSQGYPFLQIGENCFKRHECHILLQSEEISLRGKVFFPNPRKAQYASMGPLNKFWWLPCRHEAGSLCHDVRGIFWLNDRRLLFSKGKGYIEGLRGFCFPSKYQWTQCCFSKGRLESIMTLVSEISRGVPGCLCIFLYQSREYRLASYLGAKVIDNTGNTILIRQGKLSLQITVLDCGNACPMTIPTSKGLKPDAVQSVSAVIQYQCRYQNRLLFSITGQNAGFSYRV